ncbi:unnamed protein product [Didymodactylos carnosus]|uniref:Uncharacterized protein n=1 Tax=Didymodactylos carnosus TaxID=1234261 RepID=A0A814MAG9_9BILA|nr:unnamed protein product [Didymodactylos carnosus]CAF3842423.1 unnamed protein product [Didymodactylos carnosus]
MYFDDIVALCKELDSSMSEKIIVQRLMNGIRPEFRMPLFRHEPLIQHIEVFLKTAKKEQDIQETFQKLDELKFTDSKPYFALNPKSIPFTATVQQQPYQHPHHLARTSYQATHESSALMRNSFPSQSASQTQHKSPNVQQNLQSGALRSQSHKQLSTFSPQFDPCKICGREDHASIHCYYKQKTGRESLPERFRVPDCDESTLWFNSINGDRLFNWEPLVPSLLVHCIAFEALAKIFGVRSMT